MKTISLIIPSYNSRPTLPFTLEGVRRQTRFDRIREVLVVDSSTDDTTKAFLKNYELEKMFVIHAGRKVMPAISRNIGAKYATADLLVFLDSDAFMCDDWIEQILLCSDSGHRIGGGSIVMASFQKNRSVPVAQYFLQFNEFMDAGKSRVKPFLPSCNMFCDRSLFQELGGFPEIRASEDVLFFLNASKKEKVWFIPEARVFHIFRENLSSFLENQSLLGQYVFVYRKRAFNRKFYYQGKWPLVFLPFFTLIKLARITARILKARPALLPDYILVFPLFLLGLIYWSKGFVRGVSYEFS